MSLPWKNNASFSLNDLMKEAIKIIVLNLDPSIHTYSVSYVTKLEINLKHTDARQSLMVVLCE